MHSIQSQCDGAVETPDAGRTVRRVRMVGALVGLPCWAILAVAATLHADSRGYDTHTQLHLPACSMIQTTGMPCPTCGMTTAFTHMAHGQVIHAVKAQAFGTLLFLAVMLAGVLGAAQALSGRDVLARLTPRIWWLWIMLVGVVAGWAIKMGTGLASSQLPIH